MSCASLGYVESKASSSGGDLCATDESRWGVTFSTGDGSQSGLTYSTWHDPLFGSDYIDLYGSCEGTGICGGEVRCTDQTIDVASNGKDEVYVSNPRVSMEFEDHLIDLVDSRLFLIRKLVPGPQMRNCGYNSFLR